MKINSNDKMPIVVVRPGLSQKMHDTLDVLNTTGVGMVTYGAVPGDKIEFPDTFEDVRVATRQIRKDSDREEALILVKKNGELAWFGLSNLRRRDKDMKPVGEVSTHLNNCGTDYDRVKMMLGKTIVADKPVQVEVPVFTTAGVRTEDTRMVNYVPFNFA